MSYSTSGPVETILRKEDTVDPVAGNDNTQGYAIKSRWINTSSNEEWVCTDASTGAAVWELTTGGDGDVVGPATATDNRITRYDGTTGRLLQDSAVALGDNGNLTWESGATDAKIEMYERGTGPTLSAGYGKFWIKNDAPTQPHFTDDAGNEWRITLGPIAATTTNSLARFDAVGNISSPTGITFSSGSLKLGNATASVEMDEQAGPVTVAAGEGTFWVKNDAPTRPKFTDDTSVEHYLDRPTPTTLASNALIDVDATEVVIGGAYLDGSSGGVYSWEILGTYNDNGGGGNQDVIVTLYDRGPDGTPVAGVLRSTITITSLGTLDRVSQALTVAASPGTDTDEIDSDEPRLYEVRAKLDANGGVDTARILNVKFVES